MILLTFVANFTSIKTNKYHICPISSTIYNICIHKHILICYSQIRKEQQLLWSSLWIIDMTLLLSMNNTTLDMYLSTGGGRLFMYEHVWMNEWNMNGRNTLLCILYSLYAVGTSQTRIVLVYWMQLAARYQKLARELVLNL